MILNTTSLSSLNLTFISVFPFLILDCIPVHDNITYTVSQPPLRGVNEQTFNGAISPKLIAAGALGTITPQLIFDTAVFPWCPSGDKYHARHVSTFSKETQRLVFEALPYAVRKNPGSYPFLVPGMNGKYGTVGLFSQCGDAQWGELCGLSNASSF